MTRRHLALLGTLGAVVLGALWLLYVMARPVSAPVMGADVAHRPQDPTTPPASSDGSSSLGKPGHEAERLVPGAAPDHGVAVALKSRLGGAVTAQVHLASDDGAAVVLLVGGRRADQRRWRPVMSALRVTRDYHFVVVAGAPEDLRWASRVETMSSVADAEAALDYCRQRWPEAPILVVGQGDGGHVALLLAATRRDLFAFAVADPSAPKEPDAWRSRLSDVTSKRSWWLLSAQGWHVQARAALERSCPLAQIQARRTASAHWSVEHRALSGLAGWMFAMTPSTTSESLRRKSR